MVGATNQGGNLLETVLHASTIPDLDQGSEWSDDQVVVHGASISSFRWGCNSWVTGPPAVPGGQRRGNAPCGYRLAQARLGHGGCSFDRLDNRRKGVSHGWAHQP